jgi:hypothetical protein
VGKYKPSDKGDGLEQLLETMTGRTTAINNDMCIQRPWGCGEPIGPFRDQRSELEYTISGMCQTCQDTVFSHKELNDD